MGTLSKSLGSCGGYIAGCKALVEYLKYTAPGFVFSVRHAAGRGRRGAGLAPAAGGRAAAGDAAAARTPGCSSRWPSERGLNTGMSKDSPVVPVILGNSHALRCGCRRRCSPAASTCSRSCTRRSRRSAARLRFFITSQHTEEQIRYTVEVLAEEWERLSRQPAAQAAGP